MRKSIIVVLFFSACACMSAVVTNPPAIMASQKYVTAALSNRTVTVNGQVGSLGSNLNFTVEGGGIVGPYVTSVNGSTGAVVVTAAGLGALTAESDTLSSVAARGGFVGTEEIRPSSMVLSDTSTGVSAGYTSAGMTTSALELDGYAGLTYDGLRFGTYNGLGYTISHWRGYRAAGTYDIASTSDLDAKLDSTGGAANNLTLTGTTTLTNGTSFFAGVYLGTNGVAFTRNGTNYWILLP